MTTRDKRSIWIVALALLLLAVGLAMASNLLIGAGLFVVAVTVRYRKNPSVWEFLVFLVLALSIVMLGPPSSPFIGAIPLMLSYVLDYVDERRQKRAGLAKAAAGAGNEHAEPGAPPDGGPAPAQGGSGVSGGPPSVS